MARTCCAGAPGTRYATLCPLVRAGMVHEMRCEVAGSAVGVSRIREGADELGRSGEQGGEPRAGSAPGADRRPPVREAAAGVGAKAAGIAAPISAGMAAATTSRPSTLGRTAERSTR